MLSPPCPSVVFIYAYQAKVSEEAQAEEGALADARIGALYAFDDRVAQGPAAPDCSPHPAT
jgi:hypothetical protein